MCCAAVAQQPVALGGRGHLQGCAVELHRLPKPTRSERLVAAPLQLVGTLTRAACARRRLLHLQGFRRAEDHWLVDDRPLSLTILLHRPLRRPLCPMPPALSDRARARRRGSVTAAAGSAHRLAADRRLRGGGRVHLVRHFGHFGHIDDAWRAVSVRRRAVLARHRAGILRTLAAGARRSIAGGGRIAAVAGGLTGVGELPGADARRANELPFHSVHRGEARKIFDQLLRQLDLFLLHPLRQRSPLAQHGHQLGAQPQHALLAVKVAQQREPEGEDLQAEERAARKCRRAAHVRLDLRHKLRARPGQVKKAAVHRGLERGLREPVMQLGARDLHEGVDGLRAEVHVLVHEQLRQRGEPPFADKLAHERPRANVAHVEEREEVAADAILRVLIGRPAWGWRDQDHVLAHVDRLREKEQQPRLAQVVGSPADELERLEWWLLPRLAKSGGDVLCRGLVGHDAPHVLEQRLEAGSIAVHGAVRTQRDARRRRGWVLPLPLLFLHRAVHIQCKYSAVFTGVKYRSAN